MKLTIKIFLIAMIQFLTWANSTIAIGQTVNKQHVDSVASKAENFAMLVRTEEHIKAAIKTASELQNSNKFKAKEVEIIICGEAVQLMQKGSPVEELLLKAMSQKVRVVACGMSMEKQKVNKDSLIEGVKIEANGLVRIFELQILNYRTIEL